MLVGKTFAEVYEKLIKQTILYGDKVSPRGMLTKELMQETFCVEDPTENLVFIPGRKYSICHAIAESLFIFSDCDSLKVAGHFNERIKNFSDDGMTLYGDYGRRVSNYIPEIIQKLREDPDTRQALLTIHKVCDSVKVTKDQPCTITLQFTIRDNKLNMHVYMRSNDLVWGTPYDVYIFTNMQMVIANTLGIELGKYYHTATSLHIYENYFDEVKKFDGNCTSIKHVNKANYRMWKTACDSYVLAVETENRKYIKDEILCSNNCPELRVLIFEELHRNNEKYTRELNVERFTKTCSNIGDMEFCKNFTRRWAKGLIQGW